MRSHSRPNPFVRIAPHQINMAYALVRMEHVIFDPLRSSTPHSLVHLVVSVTPEEVSLREEIEAHINIGRYVARFETPPPWKYAPQPSDRKSTRLNSSHEKHPYAGFSWKKNK